MKNIEEFITLVCILMIIAIIIVCIVTSDSRSVKMEKQYNTYLAYMDILDSMAKPVETFTLKELKRVNKKLKLAIKKYPNIFKEKQNDI